MCNAYIHILNQPQEKINGEIFNVGFENYSVEKLSLLVKDIVPFDVEIEKSKTMIIDLIISHLKKLKTK